MLILPDYQFQRFFPCYSEGGCRIVTCHFLSLAENSLVGNVQPLALSRDRFGMLVKQPDKRDKLAAVAARDDSAEILASFDLVVYPLELKFPVGENFT